MGLPCGLDATVDLTDAVWYTPCSARGSSRDTAYGFQGPREAGPRKGIPASFAFGAGHMASKTAPVAEVKTFETEYQIKDNGDGRRRLIGYASTFGNEDQVGDVVETGAFTKSLTERGGKLPYLWSHDPTQPIGAIDKWSTDSKGLHTEAVMARSRQAEDVVGWAEDGILGGQSIGYRTIKFGYQGNVRHLKEVALLEVSAVVFPANVAAEFTAIKAAGFPVAVVKALPGSYEYLTCLVQDAIRESGLFQANTWIVDTFADHVVVNTYDDDYQDRHTFEVDYSFGADGTIAFGAVREIEIYEMTMPKSMPSAADFAKLLRDLRETKAGAVLSGRNKELVRAALAALSDLMAAAEPADDSAKSVASHSALLDLQTRIRQAQLSATLNHARLAGVAI